MKHLLKSLERFGIGDRALTEDDFYRLCESEGIDIIWSNEKFSFYFTLLGQHFIVLPKRSRHGPRLLFKMFHEFGHYCMHVGTSPAVAFEGVCLDRHDRDEAEADAIALIAMMPKDRLHEMAFLDGSRFGGKLWTERLRLLFIYDI